MAQVKGTFGPITIANQQVNPGKKFTQRSQRDPLNYIKISCDIPKENNYSVGSTDVFNFG